MCYEFVYIRDDFHLATSYALYPHIPFNLIKPIFSVTLFFHIPSILEFIICYDILSLCTLLTCSYQVTIF